MKKRNRGIDFLKFVCAFLVICIHVPFANISSVMIVPLCRCAVPIFFMITGYYYSSIKKEEREIKQIFKVLKLCICANLIYFIYDLVTTFIKGESIIDYYVSNFNWRTIYDLILFNDSPFSPHLWYLNAILYVLVIIYFWEQKKDRALLYPIVPMLLLLDLLWGKYSLLFFGREFDYILVRNFLFVGLPYFLIGDMICRFQIKLKKSVSIFLSILFSITTILERFILGVVGLNATRDHYISTTFLAIAVFVLALHYGNATNCKMYKNLSECGAKMSLTIYIVHPMLIEILRSMLNVETTTYVSMLYHNIAPFIVFFLSIIISWIVDIMNRKGNVKESD